MSSIPVTSSMDDLDTIAARFEADVARTAIWVNGDETADYETEDGRAVPSISKVIANVEEMIAPDVATIMQGATDATQAASAAQASAASAAQDAQSSGSAAELVESYAATVALDAATANDSADRAEAASYAAGSARDSAVGAQNSVQQNADRASAAAANADASELAAADSASTASANAHQTGLDVQAANQQAGNAAASAVAANGSETRAGQSATAAQQSAVASAQSAQDSAAHAAAIDPALFVKRAGDVMTGGLTIRNNNLMFQNSAAAFFGFLGAYGAAGAAGSASGVGFVDSTLTWWNFQIDNSGNTYTRGSATISGGLRVDGGRLQLRNGPSWGEVAMYSANGTVMFMRGRGTEGGGMQWINNDYNNIAADMDNNGQLTLFSQLRTGNGSGIFATNGDSFGSVWGGVWLSQWINARLSERAPIGALVRWWQDIVHFSSGGAFIVPQPYVAIGLSGPGNATLDSIGIYGIALVNA
jgi:hypothetical protein